jgi:hypothetical protein
VDLLVVVRQVQQADLLRVQLADQPVYPSQCLVVLVVVHPDRLVAQLPDHLADQPVYLSLCQDHSPVLPLAQLVFHHH